MQKESGLFTSKLMLLYAGAVAFMSSFSMLLPELPDFLRDLGGGEYIGYIVGLFTLSALLSRFFSGRMSDRVGRVLVMLIGSVVTCVCGFAYLFASSVAVFLTIRFLHGMSTGFRPVGSSAFLTDIIPVEKRGQALGILGVAGSVGMALGPVFGSVIREELGYDYLFVASAVLGLSSFLLTLKLPESLEPREPLSLKVLNPFKGQLLDWSSWPSAVFLLPVSFAFGVFLTLSPDFVESLGFVYKGMFNGVIVVFSILMRFVAGAASDKYGRVQVLRVGAFLLMVGMYLIGSADSILSVCIGGAVYGMSVGINMPTIFAWTADLAKPGKIGMALSTMLMSLEIGIGIGAFLSGEYYQLDLTRIPDTYYFCAILGFVSWVFILIFPASKPSIPPQTNKPVKPVHTNAPVKSVHTNKGEKPVQAKNPSKPARSKKPGKSVKS
ncbi:MAG: MFS transporter [Flavobacteriales bacterium]|nr:MFS transporter [Flavobacteriales bacterium]